MLVEFSRIHDNANWICGVIKNQKSFMKQQQGEKERSALSEMLGNGDLFLVFVIWSAGLMKVLLLPIDFWRRERAVGNESCALCLHLAHTIQYTDAGYAGKTACFSVFLGVGCGGGRERMFRDACVGERADAPLSVSGWDRFGVFEDVARRCKWVAALLSLQVKISQWSWMERWEYWQLSVSRKKHGAILRDVWGVNSGIAIRGKCKRFGDREVNVMSYYVTAIKYKAQKRLILYLWQCHRRSRLKTRCWMYGCINRLPHLSQQNWVLEIWLGQF